LRLSYILPLVLLLLSVLIQSCAGPTRGDLLKKFEERPELGAYIRGVPFYPQEKYMCGPSALTSILNYYSVGYDIDEVTEAVFEEKIQGTLLMDMLIYAKIKGFTAQVYNSDLLDLKARLRDKRPVILFLNLGSREKPKGHYIVAIGFDDESKTLIAHSGLTRAQIFPYKAIMDDWQKTGYSVLLIKP
jgi:ABC-type bacteriocin/lantibiotic exporter with double-glycine peptidase domain